MKRKIDESRALQAAVRVMGGGESMTSVARDFGVDRGTVASAIRRLPDETREQIEEEVFDLKLEVRRAVLGKIQTLLPRIDLDGFDKMETHHQAAALRDLARALQSIETVTPSVKIENNTQNNTLVQAGTVDVPKPAESREAWEETVLRVQLMAAQKATEKKTQ